MVPVYMEMRSDEKILQKQEKTPHLHRSGICLPAWNFQIYRFEFPFSQSTNPGIRTGRVDADRESGNMCC